MAGQGPARRRRASRLDPARLAALTVICLLLSGTAGAAAYFFPVVVAGVGQTGQTVVVPPGSSPNASPTPSAPPGAPFTVLLLGSDDDSKFQADQVLTQSMILVRVEPATKHVTMLSIPRDLWVPLSTGGSAKIDAAYSYGGAAAAIATVQRNFHVHIDEYAWIGLKGLIKLIDRLGGVDLFVSNPVLDDAYPNDINGRVLYCLTSGAVPTHGRQTDSGTAVHHVRATSDNRHSR